MSPFTSSSVLGIPRVEVGDTRDGLHARLARCAGVSVRLVGEQPVLHRVGLALFAREPDGDRRFARRLVRAAAMRVAFGIQREVLRDERDLAGILLLQLRQDRLVLREGLSARRALIVVELDDHDRRAAAADEQSARAAALARYCSSCWIGALRGGGGRRVPLRRRRCGRRRAPGSMPRRRSAGSGKPRRQRRRRRQTPSSGRQRRGRTKQRAHVARRAAGKTASWDTWSPRPRSGTAR